MNDKQASEQSISVEAWLVTKLQLDIEWKKKKRATCAPEGISFVVLRRAWLNKKQKKKTDNKEVT